MVTSTAANSEKEEIRLSVGMGWRGGGVGGSWSPCGGSRLPALKGCQVALLKFRRLLTWVSRGKLGRSPGVWEHPRQAWFGFSPIMLQTVGQGSWLLLQDSL